MPHAHRPPAADPPEETPGDRRAIADRRAGDRYASPGGRRGTDLPRELPRPPAGVWGTIESALLSRGLQAFATIAMGYAVGHFTGMQDIAELKTQMRANDALDSLSIVDRAETRRLLIQVATLVGRAECKRMTAAEAADLAIPCTALRSSQDWPVPPGPMQRRYPALPSTRLDVSPRAPGMPAPATTLVMFVPVVPTGRWLTPTLVAPLPVPA